MGENNFTHTFSSIHDEWIVRQVFALLETNWSYKIKMKKLIQEVMLKALT